MPPWGTYGLTKVEPTWRKNSSVVLIAWTHHVRDNVNRSKVYAQILLPTSSAAEYPLATVGMRQEEQWNYFNWLLVCLKRQSPSPACASYRGPLAKADNYYYKTEGSWINAKQSQKKSRISNRLDERITESKLKEILWTQKTAKKKKKVNSSIAPKYHPD